MMSISRLVIHEGWNDQTSDNDIAVIILAAKVEFTETINAAALNPANVVARKTFDSSSDCYITGWGTTEGIPFVLHCQRWKQ